MSQEITVFTLDLFQCVCPSATSLTWTGLHFYWFLIVSTHLTHSKGAMLIRNKLKVVSGFPSNNNCANRSTQLKFSRRNRCAVEWGISKMVPSWFLDRCEGCLHLTKLGLFFMITRLLTLLRNEARRTLSYSWPRGEQIDLGQTSTDKHGKKIALSKFSYNFQKKDASILYE